MRSKLEVCLEPFDPEEHSRILREWLNRPHVSRWWGDPQLALEGSLRYPAENCAVIIAEGVPIGYLCWQKPPREELKTAGLADLPEDLVDIDILIGEPEFLGHGLGPRSLGLLLASLQADPIVSVAGLGTSVSNERAIRAFKKAGFRLFRKFHDPEFGVCLYMTVEVRDAA